MCTRTLFTAQDGRVVTGRNMDWVEDINTDFWAFRAGMQRNLQEDREEAGLEITNGVSWTSKYSTLIAAGFDMGVADGMNEAGLVGNILFLTESNYGEDSGGDRPTLTTGAWLQYMLDHCANVAEAVELMESESFRLIATTMPDGRPLQQHMSMSDATGDSAIFEFIDGVPSFHHGREYTVLTNSPSYDQQLKNKDDLTGPNGTIDGENKLPGTRQATDRFVRAWYYLNQLSTDVDAHQAAAGVLSVQRNAASPLGEPQPGRPPELSQTIWTTVIDSTDRRYYFQHTSVPNIFWIDFDRVNFANAESQCLELQEGEGEERRPSLQVHGEQSAQFKPRKPFLLC